MFALEGCQMNYVIFKELINYRKRATVFTKTLVHAIDITLHGY